MLDRRDVRRYIVAIPTRSIDRHNLINRCTHMSDQRSRHLPLNVPIPDEPIPMVETILPTVHHGIATPVLVDTGTICHTAFIAQRASDARFAGGAKARFLPEERQAYTGSMPYFPQVIQGLSFAHCRGMICL